MSPREEPKLVTLAETFYLDNDMMKVIRDRPQSSPAPSWVLKEIKRREAEKDLLQLTLGNVANDISISLAASRPSAGPAPNWVLHELARRSHWYAVSSAQSLPRLDIPQYSIAL